MYLVFVCVCFSQVSQELSESITTMYNNATVLFNKPRQQPPGVVGTHKPPAFTSGVGGQVMTF